MSEVYIEIFNRREHPDQPLQEESKRGAKNYTFGPFLHVQFTYGSYIFLNDGVSPKFLHLFNQEYVFYDGGFYGDFKVISTPGDKPVQKFDEKLSDPKDAKLLAERPVPF
jgi:hypothetical protein